MLIVTDAGTLVVTYVQSLQLNECDNKCDNKVQWTT